MYGVRIFGKVDDVVQEILKHENNGWINLEILEKRKAHDWNTHYLIVDQFAKNDENG